MKKNILSVFALILFAAVLTSCGLIVTPVAYTRFEATGTQYVYYSSDEYGLTEGQIEVYKDENEFKDEYGIADLEFHFTDCYGKDYLGEYWYTPVSLKNFPVELTVNIWKDSPNYSADKQIYLNGEALVPDQTDDLETIKALTFHKMEEHLIRTNYLGQLDEEAVNVIEYK